MMLVTGHDRAICAWAESKFVGLNFASMHSAFGVADRTDGTLIGAALFSDYYPGGNVELTYYGPGTLTRSVLNAISFYAFVTLNASRVTCKTKRENKDVARLLSKAGFKFECVQKRYFGPTESDDAVVYSFPVEMAAKWLKRMN